MDRSNSVSSTSSSTSSRQGTEPFAYQTRLLERNSSGRNTSFLSQSNSGSRRWTPSHRAGQSSLDSVRGKWEARAKAEAELNNQSSPSRSSFSTDDVPTAPPSPSSNETPHNSSRMSSSRSFQSSSSVKAEPVTPPSLTKRHTMPEPIIASPLSPNSTGITVVSPNMNSLTSTNTVQTNRIHFPVPRASFATMRQKFDEAGLSADNTSEISTSTRSRRSIDFDTIMKDGRSTPSRLSKEEPSRSEDPSPRRTRPTSLYGTPHFSTLPRQESVAATREKLTRPGSSDKSQRSSSPVKLARTSSDIPSSSERSSRHSSIDLTSSNKSVFSSSKQDSSAPSSPEKTSRSQPIKLPRRNSVKDSPFLRSESPTPVSSRTPYRPPPASPSTFSNVPSSVMSPTPYRSSYMANKKAGLYGDEITVGRRLGRHLPRIASGDAYDEPETPKAEVKQKAEAKQEARLPVTPERPTASKEVKKNKSPEPNSRLSRQERREKRIREWQAELEQKRNTPSKQVSYSPGRESFAVPHTSDAIGQSADDVAGVPGRKRLSRDVIAPPESPFGAKMPLPSSRLGIRSGLWADTQRHLIRAYEYLCHVGEAQQWIEGCLGEELGFGVVEMEESLRNGVVLAKLARRFLGENVVRRIFEAPKLDFRQTDNINHFFEFVRDVGLPECFIFETTDLYNKKNIPKVIYCIHALSHLLARRGLAQRIGNLLGQLEFSDDQLQRTEKGLKDAGVPMPNFGAISRELAKEINEEPEVEIETEEERRDRELMENEDSIVKLQSALRGFLVRKEQATRRARLQLAERYIVKFQARCRGLATRQNMQEIRKKQMDLTPWVLALQARARGIISRRAWKERLSRIRALTKFIIKVQAQSRGVLLRRRYALLKAALVKSKVSVLRLQAFARARLAKRSHQQIQKTLGEVKTMQGVVRLQAVGRGILLRRKISKQLQILDNVEDSVIQLQAHVRGVLIRRHIGAQLAKLDDSVDVVVRIQAAARCYLARKRLLNLIRGLRRATPAIVQVQALARAILRRKQHVELKRALGEVKTIKAVGTLQALARAALVRKHHVEQSKKLEFCQPDVLGFQAVCRGALARRDYLSWRDYLRNSQEEATHLQALFRGFLERRKFIEKMRYYRENLSKVIKIQSLFRAKETREQYRQLTLGHNVNVSTIKNFVHLLDDSEADFEDEIELERLRKRVVQSIRTNQHLETEVDELDVKIALVVQNVKSFEELVKARRRNDSVGAHAARASVLAAHGDPFAGASSLDHESKRKLELYQQLFYLLQTRAEYLGKLFQQLAKGDIPDKSKKLVERVVLTLFGYGQDRREEYLLLKLFQHAIRNDISLAPTVNHAMKELSLYLFIALQYGRPKQVTYLRDVLQANIHMVLDGVASDMKLDLETDPCVVYRQFISREEMRTGMKSNEPPELPLQEASYHPETRVILVHNFQKLVSVSTDFVNCILGSIRKMPYNIRFLARELLAALKDKFADQPEESYAIPLCRLLFHRYIEPALVAPETFDIVPTTIDIATRKNLAQVSKVIRQICSGELFTQPNFIPINAFVQNYIPRFRQWVFEVANVTDAETQYHANEFLDVAVQPKPIYISPNEVYSMHSLISQHLERMAPKRDDPLRSIILELGGVPHLSGGSDELNAARDTMITLELTNRFANVKDPQAEEKALWVQAKRSVLSILRVQPARDLVECLMQPVSEEHEMFWEDIVDRELMNDHMRQKQRRMPSSTGADSAYRLDDIRSLTFKEVKAHAIYFLLELEKQGKVTRNDGYQGILNAIAGDVRSKHRKRLQRQQELASMNEALQHLAERKKHYEEQIKSYNDYVETAMNTMQKGKSKKRFVMPFTKQFFHLRDLQKSGRSPQFGSFKYSAQQLYEKGILLSIDQYSPRQFDRIDVVLSSNKAGLFDIELYKTNAGTSSHIASTEIRMEDLLQAQFENRVSLPLFDGMAKFNLNLLLYQINKKFYV